MSSYFNALSFSRAKKNKDELEKSNPQNPVLKDEDEKFLERHISQDEAAKAAKDADTTKITDDGQEKPVPPEEQKAVGEGQAVVPATQPEGPEALESATTKDSSPKKHKYMELPSQEEAEAATRGWNDQVKLDDKDNTAGEKRTWASYIPNSLKPVKKDAASVQKTGDSSSQDATKQTWTAYAASYVPASWTKSKEPDSQPEPVYNEDGTIDEKATAEKQEREISVLLDNLNMSALNNRVFALSGETQKLYERFAQVLKDTINGAPTAYEDMDKLMRDAGPTLEKQFKSMPPFVQTLVKSLPVKLGGTLGPEILAATSEKPGADMNARLKTASEGKEFNPGAASKSGSSGEASAKKKKRKIPGLKSLVSKEGAVAGILRNTVTFLQTRFPFLASTTNVVMSLAVFILMFVFWYCHKRGKEVRLAKAAKAGKDGAAEDEDEDEDELEVDDSDEEATELEERLKQPDPATVPLPDDDNNEKPAV